MYKYGKTIEKVQIIKNLQGRTLIKYTYGMDLKN